MKNLIRNFAFFLGLVFCLSCSNETLDQEITEIDSADLKIGVELETTEDQLDRLKQKMRRFHNFQVAQAQGWDVDGSGYVPNMGHHFINQDLMDGEFELLKPEALLYIPDENGNWEFLAVEYLLTEPGPEGPAPEGFIGDEDVWFYNPSVQAWTLHAWIVKENSAGVFVAFNSEVP